MRTPCCEDTRKELYYFAQSHFNFKPIKVRVEWRRKEELQPKKNVSITCWSIWDANVREILLKKMKRNYYMKGEEYNDKDVSWQIKFNWRKIMYMFFCCVCIICYTLFDLLMLMLQRISIPTMSFLWEFFLFLCTHIILMCCLLMITHTWYSFHFL